MVPPFICRPVIPYIVYKTSRLFSLYSDSRWTLLSRKHGKSPSVRIPMTRTLRSTVTFLFLPLQLTYRMGKRININGNLQESESRVFFGQSINNKCRLITHHFEFPNPWSMNRSFILPIINLESDKTKVQAENCNVMNDRNFLQRISYRDSQLRFETRSRTKDSLLRHGIWKHS